MVEISSKGEYPACALSNFAPHAFVLDGVSCASMEGFLQGLKYRDPARQAEVCALTGKAAKKAGGSKYLWRLAGRVWWRGRAYGLFSDELERLKDRAYGALFSQCPEFRQALADLNGEPMAHSIGKRDARQTILTEYDFLRRLELLRSRL